MKQYLKLETFEENGSTMFGWKKIDPNRKRKHKSILQTDIAIVSEDLDSKIKTFIKDEDIGEYIELSLGMSAKDLFSKWSENPFGFEDVLRQISMGYEIGQGAFFIDLCNLHLNDKPFQYKNIKYYKLSLD